MKKLRCNELNLKLGFILIISFLCLFFIFKNQSKNNKEMDSEEMKAKKINENPSFPINVVYTWTGEKTD